ncbi:MAG TPA: hypothetical protein VK489_10450 [Ferruginibacter sp.]|nr:hypothetical protein [Ferruginibacter sp.]
MARRTEEYQYPAYAVKSDDGEKPKEKPISCLCCKRRRWQIEEH